MPDNSKKKIIFVIVSLIVLAVISYGNSLNNGFLLDDEILILGEDNLSKYSYFELATNAHRGFYRPVSYLLFKTEIMLFGAQRSPYHVVNILLMCLIAFLNYLLMKRIAGRDDVALLASCLFLVHPLNTIFINLKAGINLSILVLCMQASTLFFLGFLDKECKKKLYLSLMFYFLALLSHEISFILPLSLIWIAVYLNKYNLKKNFLISTLYLIPLGIYIALRYLIVGSDARSGYSFMDLTGFNLSLSQYLGTLSQTMSWYFTKLFVPNNIIFIWNTRVSELNAAILPFLLILSFIALLVFFAFKIRSIYSFGLIFFAIGLIPLLVISFIYTAKTGSAIIEPHSLAYSSIGFYVFIASLVCLIKDKNNAKIFMIVAIGIVTALALTTRKGNADWKDAYAYCSYWIKTNPYNLTAYACRAKDEVKQYDKGLASNHYKDCSEAADVGALYNVMGDTNKALDYFKLSLEMNKDCPMAYYGLGLLYRDRKDFGRAEQAFLHAIKAQPGHLLFYKELLDIYLNTGDVYKQNKLKAAIQEFQKSRFLLLREKRVLRVV